MACSLGQSEFSELQESPVTSYQLRDYRIVMKVCTLFAGNCSAQAIPVPLINVSKPEERLYCSRMLRLLCQDAVDVFQRKHRIGGGFYRITCG